jgi:MFS family permease
VTQGFFFSFVLVAAFFGLLAGALIDRLGARESIRYGIGCVGLSLMLMGKMTELWHYYVLCFVQVVGYVLAGPIPNQVLVSNWFRAKRGRAMGYAYLGLGLGGVVSADLTLWLIRRFGWRGAFQIIGLLVLIVLFPVAQWVTRSWPRELGLQPDGDLSPGAADPVPGSEGAGVRRAVRTLNFWLIILGSTLTIGAIGTVIQHFVLFQLDLGYTKALAARAMRALLISSLAGRVIVGYFADRYVKKNLMALFYLALGVSIPLLFWAQRDAALWGFAVVFGFAMGADYMLIPLVTAECFGLKALGKLLALIILAYSPGQWGGPWLAGKIFDATSSYNLAWVIIAVAGVLGSATIYAISPRRGRPAASE